MNQLLLTFFSILITSTCFAQTDTEFWFVAPDVSRDHGDSPVNFRVSTFDQEATIRISIPANPNFRPVTREITANGTITVDLTYALSIIENQPADQVLNKGIYITATSPVTVYYEVSSFVNPEIFPLKGRNALGKSFLVPGQDLFNNENGNATVELVATEDSTEIIVTPSSAIIGHGQDETFTILLNRGETYSLRAASTFARSGLGGTRIDSSKPIAVTIIDDSIRNGDSWDLVGDQLVPISQLGTNYIAVRGYATTEIVFVWATEDNTTVSIDGTRSPITMAAGTSMRVNISGRAVFISADKPVYVYQLTGHGGEIGDAVLPQIECTGSGQVGFVRSSSNAFALMLLTRDGNQGDFVLDGRPINIFGQFRTVPGTNGEWVAALVDFNLTELFLGPHLLQNTGGFFHMGILHQLGPSSVYGYFSNYNSFSGKEVKLCPGGATVLDPGPQFDSYKWSTGSTDRQITINSEGTYTVELTFEGCSAIDTFNVIFEPTSVNLGDDRLICEDETIFLNPGEYNTYNWQKQENENFNSNAAILQVSDSGTYFLEVSNRCGTYLDTIKIEETPKPTFALAEDFTVCDASEVILEAEEGFDSYLWQTGDTTETTVVETSGVYQVQVTKGACVLSDSIAVKFQNTPTFLSIGEDRTVCVKEESVLKVEGEEYEYFSWSNDSTKREITVEGGGTFSVTAGNECGEHTASVTFTPITKSDLFFSNAFSPNGDGVNDTFELDSWLVGSRVKIFNRWGEPVFQSESYNNNWGAKNLTVGLYYYEIWSPCLLETYTGWLRILQ